MAVIKVLAGKRWIVWFGLMLVVASLVYLGVQLLTFREQIAAWKADYRSLVLLGISMFVYALANFAHFFSWQKILVGLSERTESLLIIFARSQLGKYLPGNVLHIAGRHILARDLGYNHGALLLSTLYEFAGLLTASGSVLAFSVYWYASLYLGSGHFIFIGVAAVADYRPAVVEDQKIKKSSDEMTIKLVKNPDILSAVARHDNRPFTVGFAAETENLVENARNKLKSKKVDVIVANDVSEKHGAFGNDSNAATLIHKDGEINLGRTDKYHLAVQIIENICELGGCG